MRGMKEYAKRLNHLPGGWRGVYDVTSSHRVSHYQGQLTEVATAAASHSSLPDHSISHIDTVNQAYMCRGLVLNHPHNVRRLTHCPSSV